MKSKLKPELGLRMPEFKILQQLRNVLDYQVNPFNYRLVLKLRTPPCGQSEQSASS